ncbi:MAG: superoxide dismutase family protein [Rubricoccaceae bacterium]|nr:superoxide dismutase family protein [Rubricoccaceae bacterium]
MFFSLRFPSILLLVIALAVQGCATDGGSDTEADQDVDATAESEVSSDGTNANHPDDETTVRAVARIEGLGGSGVSGNVTFAHRGGGLQVTYMLEGLEPGAHGFHVHENGSCADGEDGTPGGAAGGHFNPDSSLHGANNQNPPGRHVGDFGNITAGESGSAFGSFSEHIATLDGPNGIIGKAIVIHGGEDDFSTQPSGDAGVRVGCGIIEDAPES